MTIASDTPADQRRRRRMVRDQLNQCADPRVVAVMGSLPRHAFVSASARLSAYDDHPFAIGAGQTISQPRLVATMLAELAVQPGQVVLDVGAGSGYVSALAAHLVGPAGMVFALERQAGLVAAARAPLTQHARGEACAPVHLACADGAAGLAAHAPFDRIHVGCASEHVPAELVDQLAPGGRMVLPVGGDGGDQELLTVTRDASGNIRQRRITAVTFVPMLPGVVGSDQL